MTAKTVQKKAQKEVTLAEFKAWLEGVEELQDRNWVPDLKQWKLIRNKIKKISDTAPVAPISNTEVPLLQPQTQTPTASALGIPPAPISGGVGGIPVNAEIIGPSPDAQAMLTGETRKTPDIDTSTGQYASDFT